MISDTVILFVFYLFSWHVFYVFIYRYSGSTSMRVYPMHNNNDRTAFIYVFQRDRFHHLHH